MFARRSFLVVALFAIASAVGSSSAMAGPLNKSILIQGTATAAGTYTVSVHFAAPVTTVQVQVQVAAGTPAAATCFRIAGALNRQLFALRYSAGVGISLAQQGVFWVAISQWPGSPNQLAPTAITVSGGAPGQTFTVCP